MSSQQDVALKIKDTVASLLRTRREISATEFPEHDVAFSDADAEWGAGGNVGPLASMQGIRTVFNAAAALSEDPVGLWDVIEPDLKSLIEEWESTLERLNSDKGYDADPYDSGNDLSLLFELDDQQPCYTDTVALALSTSVLINFVAKLRPALFTSNQHLQERTRAQILKCLQTLIQGQCSDGGWSWRPSNEHGHLVFTWSAVAGLTDVFDYILGNNEKAIDIGPDPLMKEYLTDADSQILDKLRLCRDRAAAFLSERYLQAGKDKGLLRTDVTHDDIFIEPSNDLVLIYCELYLLEALVLTRYAEPGGVESRERKDEIELLYRTIARKFPHIRRPEFAGNPDTSTLTFEIRGTEQIRRQTPIYIPQDGGIWAQLLRTLVLYRYYVKRDSREDPDILGEEEGALRLLLAGRRPEGAQYSGVWDKNDFNLGITVRAIEGLVDCYDYFDLLKKMNPIGQATPASQQPTPATVHSTEDVATLLADAIYPHIERRLAERLDGDLGETFVSRLAERVGANTGGRTESAGDLSDSDMTSLRNEMFSSLREAAIPKFLELIGDAIGALPAKEDVNRDSLMHSLMSKAPAEQLRGLNEPAYDLLSMLIWLNFNVNSRLWGLTLQEAIIDRIADRDLREKFKQKDGQDGVLPLSDRLSAALSLLADLSCDPWTGRKSNAHNTTG